MNRIVVIGGINLDLVIQVQRIPRPGETVSGGALARIPGGKGANQAVAAAQAGANVHMVGAVGRDESGSMMLGSLEQAGVDISHIAQVGSESTGTALIAVDASGSNAISVAPGANVHVNAREVAETVSELSPEVVLTQLETPTEVVRQVVSRRLPGTTYILNAAPLDPESIDLASCMDILIVNAVEASILIGHTVDSFNAMEVAGELAERQTRGCAITLGNAGVAAVLDGAEHRLEPHPVEVVDTTGAGDAFCGALAAGLVSGLTLVDALVWGNAAGALATTRAGAQPSMPTAAKIRALLSKTLV